MSVCRARVLILDRTPWHMTWEACDRSAPAVSSTGRACQRESCGRSHTRLFEGEASATSASRAAEPHPSSRAPSALSPSSPALAAHTLDQDSPASGNVSRAGDDCGVVVLKRSWHDHRPASQTGQGGACSRPARNRRSPPLPRPEQRRVEGSPLSRGRRDHCSAPKTRGPVTADGLAAPLRAARRRAAPPPDDY